MKLLLPKEHGAYGQMLFPLVTSLLVVGMKAASLLMAAAVIAGFLAHEPAMLLLGFRGPRARREHQRDATAGVLLFGVLLAAAGIAAVMMMPGGARWSVLLPLVPTLFLVFEASSGREKAWPAEVAVATAFSLAAIPMCMAGAAPLADGALIAGAFGVNFVLATLGVRVIILRVRAGGNIRAASATRNAVFALALGALAVALTLLARHAVPPLGVAALLPGLVSGAAVAWIAPPPSQLRRVGWALVGVSTLIAVMLVVSLRLLR